MDKPKSWEKEMNRMNKLFIALFFLISQPFKTLKNQLSVAPAYATTGSFQ